MATPDTYRTHCDTFTAAVRDLCRTPAIRAALERGHGRPVEECDRRAHGVLAPLARGFGARRAHWTVAGLIALERPDRHPLDLAALHTQRSALPWYRRPNIGTSLAQAFTATPRDRDNAARRLRALTHLGPEQLHRTLPGLTRRLLHQAAAPDFAVLLSDLAAWDTHRRTVGTRWLDGFHLTPALTDDTEPTPHTTDHPTPAAPQHPPT
ncbi:type I-E CRISPR-associated protein Cse2/CasB [Streptomyces cyaneofuscatus]|uniref:type I-E CRISPR-associated protein Cse2/CasB n=1 Tax=Streptomyces cyaneofuscatus TaxID=66883 RepID=UPI003686BF08